MLTEVALNWYFKLSVSCNFVFWLRPENSRDCGPKAPPIGGRTTAVKLTWTGPAGRAGSQTDIKQIKQHIQ